MIQSIKFSYFGLRVRCSIQSMHLSGHILIQHLEIQLGHEVCWTGVESSCYIWLSSLVHSAFPASFTLNFDISSLDLLVKHLTQGKFFVKFRSLIALHLLSWKLS